MQTLATFGGAVFVVGFILYAVYWTVCFVQDGKDRYYSKRGGR